MDAVAHVVVAAMPHATTRICCKPLGDAGEAVITQIGAELGAVLIGGGLAEAREQGTERLVFDIRTGDLAEISWEFLTNPRGLRGAPCCWHVEVARRRRMLRRSAAS